MRKVIEITISNRKDSKHITDVFESSQELARFLEGPLAAKSVRLSSERLGGGVVSKEDFLEEVEKIGDYESLTGWIVSPENTDYVLNLISITVIPITNCENYQLGYWSEKEDYPLYLLTGVENASAVEDYLYQYGKNNYYIGCSRCIVVTRLDIPGGNEAFESYFEDEREGILGDEVAQINGIDFRIGHFVYRD